MPARGVDLGASEETKTTFLQEKWTSYANFKNGIVTTYLKTPNVVRHKMNMNTVTLYSPPTPDTFTGKIVTTTCRKSPGSSRLQQLPPTGEAPWSR